MKLPIMVFDCIILFPLCFMVNGSKYVQLHGKVLTLKFELPMTNMIYTWMIMLLYTCRCCSTRFDKLVYQIPNCRVGVFRQISQSRWIDK